MSSTETMSTSQVATLYLCVLRGQQAGSVLRALLPSGQPAWKAGPEKHRFCGAPSWCAIPWPWAPHPGHPPPSRCSLLALRPCSHLLPRPPPRRRDCQSDPWAPGLACSQLPHGFLLLRHPSQQPLQLLPGQAESAVRGETASRPQHQEALQEPLTSRRALGLPVGLQLSPGDRVLLWR